MTTWATDTPRSSSANRPKWPKVDNTGAQGSKQPFPAWKSKETAIDESGATEIPEETPTSLTNHAPAASSGGVGAVRRAGSRRPGRRTRALTFVAVLGLFASGAGNSAPRFAALSGAQLLSPVRLAR